MKNRDRWRVRVMKATAEFGPSTTLFFDSRSILLDGRGFFTEEAALRYVQTRQYGWRGFVKHWIVLVDQVPEDPLS